MTAQELKDYISAQLVVPVNLVSKVINSLFAMVDFTTTQVSSIIPDWTAVLTFNTDGSGAGIYCKHPDTNGKKRIFETKTDANINNAPPTNPLVTENTYWREVSASSSASIPEWEPGVFGPNLIIVYHNHSVDGRGLYVLLEPVRPYNSTNIETEITAGDWEPIASGGGGGVVIAGTYSNIAALLADQGAQDEGSWYMVDDASTDATVDAGWAIYEKLAATTGAITDYIKRAEQESLDISFPNGSETVAGKFEEPTDPEMQAGTATGATGAKLAVTPAKLATWWTWVKTQAHTFASQITFTSAIRLNSVTANQFLKSDGSKDVVSVASASQSDMITGTDDTKPATALSVESKRSVKRLSVAVSSGTMTIDCGSKEEVKAEDTSAISSAFTLAFSNNSNLEILLLHLLITGGVPITMPSSVVMEEADTRWNNGTKILTITGTTGSGFQLSFSKRGSVYELLVSSKFHAS